MRFRKLLFFCVPESFFNLELDRSRAQSSTFLQLRHVSKLRAFDRQREDAADDKTIWFGYSAGINNRSRARKFFVHFEGYADCKCPACPVRPIPALWGIFLLSRTLDHKGRPTPSQTICADAPSIHHTSHSNSQAIADTDDICVMYVCMANHTCKKRCLQTACKHVK